MTRLVVHIDRLVLHGVAPSDRAALARALQQELQQQLAEPGALQRWTALDSRPRLQVAPLRDAPPGGAALGAALARHLCAEAK
ncbi:MAG: hypothetical protein ACK515_23265 [bacterium]|jgi:hypothetical protein|nr:hypothetical protein [Betaproteobacteria bacterium]